MITIFTTAQPFRGRNAIAQRNALRSWQVLHSDVQIMLFGDADGSQEVAWELGIHYEEHPHATAGDSVRLDHMFAKAQSAARYTALCYVACDTILLADFCQAFNRVEALYPEFVMVGRSRNISGFDLQSFEDLGWECRYRELAQRQTRQRFGENIAFVAFSKGLYLNDVPALPAGTPFAFDWLMRKAITEEVTVVDVSEMVFALRQSCDGGEAGTVDSARDATAKVSTARSRQSRLCGFAKIPYRLTSTDVVRNHWQRMWYWRERVQRWLDEALQAWRETARQLKKPSGLGATDVFRSESSRR
jgi:hypothetical protein